MREERITIREDDFTVSITEEEFELLKKVGQWDSYMATARQWSLDELHEQALDEDRLRDAP